jgi:hypothetical protein
MTMPSDPHPTHPPIVPPNQGLPTPADFEQQTPDSLAEITTAVPEPDPSESA